MRLGVVALLLATVAASARSTSTGAADRGVETTTYLVRAALVGTRLEITEFPKFSCTRGASPQVRLKMKRARGALIRAAARLTRRQPHEFLYWLRLGISHFSTQRIIGDGVTAFMRGGTRHGYVSNVFFKYKRWL